MKLPSQKIPLTSDFHDALMAAKNKAHVIDIFCHRAGQHGWFNDMPEGKLRLKTGEKYQTIYKCSAFYNYPTFPPNPLLLNAYSALESV